MFASSPIGNLDMRFTLERLLHGARNLVSQGREIGSVTCAGEDFVKCEHKGEVPSEVWV